MIKTRQDSFPPEPVAPSPATSPATAAASPFPAPREAPNADDVASAPATAPSDIAALLGAASDGPAIMSGPNGETAVVLSIDAYNRLRNGPDGDDAPDARTEQGEVVAAGSGRRAALSRSLRMMIF